MHIRKTDATDCEAVRQVHLSAFPEEERELVATLAVDLLNEQTTPETISLIAEVDGVVAGHAVFSPVFAEANDDWSGYILAPVGVAPEHQKDGIGSQLIESGMALLSKQGINALLVYGDPKYYGRFGFSAEAAVKYVPPYELEFPFGWQAIELADENPVAQPVQISCVASLSDPKLW